jgi:hypothetical protein
MRPTTTLLRSLSARAFAFALIGTTLLAACGGGDDDNGPSSPTPPDTQPSEQDHTLFAMQNSSSEDALYVYIKSCGAASWGQDRLGATRVLDVGEVITWTVNQPGCYDVRARTSSSGGQKAEFMGVNVAEHQTTTVTIHDADWQPY